MNDRIQEIQAERLTAEGERLDQLNAELAHLVVRASMTRYEPETIADLTARIVDLRRGEQ